MLTNFTNRKKLQSHLLKEDFLSCIIHVRTICEEISSSTDGFGVGDNSVLLLQLDSRYLTNNLFII